MGSTARGQLSGFICRLCSKMNRFVVPIYGVDGVRLRLENKINSFLPIKVTRRDKLPKTICVQCLEKVLTHYKMFKNLQRCINEVKKHRGREINKIYDNVT